MVADQKCIKSSTKITMSGCPLYLFREGHNPFAKKLEWTDEQREAQRARMA